MVTSAVPFAGAAASHTHSGPVPSSACGAQTEGPAAAVAGGRCREWPAVTFASRLRGQGDVAWTNPGRAASLCRFGSPHPSGKLRGHKGWRGRCEAIPLLLLPWAIPRGCPVSQPGGGHRGVRGSRGRPCLRGGPGGMFIHPRSAPCSAFQSYPSPGPLSLPSVSPSAQPDGRSPGNESGRYSVAFGKVARSGLPPHIPTLPHGRHPWGRGGLAPQNPAGFAPLGRFPELLPNPLCELVARTNCCDSPFRPFSPPPPIPNGGCQCTEPAGTPCRSRVRK